MKPKTERDHVEAGNIWPPAPTIEHPLPVADTAARRRFLQLASPYLLVALFIPGQRLLIPHIWSRSMVDFYYGAIGVAIPAVIGYVLGYVACEQRVAIPWRIAQGIALCACYWGAWVAADCVNSHSFHLYYLYDAATAAAGYVPALIISSWLEPLRRAVTAGLRSHSSPGKSKPLDHRS